MKRLDSRSVIVTGAASGLGRGTALRLLAEGARVAALDIDDTALDELATSLEPDHRARLLTHRVDISDENSVRAAMSTVLAEFGTIEGLVNAAGILYGDHTHEMTLDRWNRLIQVNLTGTFLMIRESLPALTSAPGGVIINFASTSAFFAHPYMAAYSATKGAIAALTHSIALEYSRQGLRAVNIVPGGIASGMTDTTLQNLPTDIDYALLGKLRAALNGGELGRPEDVAGVIVMLLSDDGAFITGTEIRIDGGAHM